MQNTGKWHFTLDWEVDEGHRGRGSGKDETQALEGISGVGEGKGVPQGEGTARVKTERKSTPREENHEEFSVTSGCCLHRVVSDR